MALTLNQIRTYVRTHIDLDEADLPNSLLDVFIREGSKRIEEAAARWPFYEALWPVTTTVGQRSIPFATVNPQLAQIAAVIRDDGPLGWIGFDLYETVNPATSTTQGKPSRFSWWNDTLYLAPTPDAVYTLTARGYRRPTDWVALGAGGMPDMPDQLHNTVATWALSKSYIQQEDPELGSLYERQFVDELNEFRRRIVEVPHPQPVVLNGQRMVSPGPLGRLRFDWEP